MSGLISKVKQYMNDPVYRMKREISRGKYNDLSDEEFIKKYFRVVFGYEPDLADPKTFSEKLQWLKLHDRKDIYTTMADKYAVKDYVANIIGSEYIIPTLGVWERAEDIDFDSLPDRFAMKTTHDSHALIICRDKSRLDIGKAREKMAAGLNRSYYLRYREWPYKNIKPRVIAEQYMEDASGELSDYKVHNFNGEPGVILVCRGRFEKDGMTEDFFDTEWNHLDVRRPDSRNSSGEVPKPEQLREILALSRKLAASIAFCRTDFYIIEGRVYFGEITFFPASGFKRFIPEKYDRIFGDRLELPKNK